MPEQVKSQSQSQSQSQSKTLAKTLPRLYVDAPLIANESLALGGKQAHYLRGVLRLSVGASVLVFNGRQGEWLAHIAALDKKSAHLMPQQQLRQQEAASSLWLLAAPIKRDRLDYLAQKATEMGVGRLWPIITQHTQQSMKNPKRANDLCHRLKANAIEAAEQCGIVAVPEIAAPIALAALLADWPQAGGGRQLIFCDESAPPAQGMHALRKLNKNQQFAVLIGPEGGFTADEIAALHARPDCHSISLGPRILRADTAMVAALAIVQSKLGDWYDGVE